MIKAETLLNYLNKHPNAKRKRFGKYVIIFNGLIWVRNLWDGYECHVYDYETNAHLTTITI